MGERDLALQKREGCGAEPMQVGTFSGRIHVEWDTDSSVMSIGQLALFAVFPKDAGVFLNPVGCSWRHTKYGNLANFAPDTLRTLEYVLLYHLVQKSFLIQSKK